MWRAHDGCARNRARTARAASSGRRQCPCRAAILCRRAPRALHGPAVGATRFGAMALAMNTVALLPVAAAATPSGRRGVRAAAPAGAAVPLRAALPVQATRGAASLFARRPATASCRVSAAGMVTASATSTATVKIGTRGRRVRVRGVVTCSRGSQRGAACASCAA